IDEQTYRIPLLGKHHAQNATYAIVLGKKLGIDRQAIHKALMEIELTSMRFEMMKGKNGVSVINDAYNASPTSMKAAIDVVKQMEDRKSTRLNSSHVSISYAVFCL